MWRSAREMPAYTSGTSTFSIRFSLGQQIVLLEDKAQHLVADSGQLVAVHLAHIPAIEPVGAVGSTSRQPMMFMQVDAALGTQRALWPGHHDLGVGVHAGAQTVGVVDADGDG